MDCRTVCTNVCGRAADGKCQDGWLGDEDSSGHPACALGTDCADCGSRRLCAADRAAPQLVLPKYVLPRSEGRPRLRAVQVLFMVMGSSGMRANLVRAFSSWCRSGRGIRCLFFSDAIFTDGSGGAEMDGQRAAVSIAGGAFTVSNRTQLPLVTVSMSPPPRSCCTASHKKGFFCNTHRSTTLRAQYRFLPALAHVKRSAAFASGAFRWLVLVDDDSYVFTSRLLWLLALLQGTD